jgi:hypothetical protein
MTLRKLLYVLRKKDTAQKAELERAANQAGVELSALSPTNSPPPAPQQFTGHIGALCRAQGEPTGRRLALAALHDFLAQRSTRELQMSILSTPSIPDDPFSANYLAAMIEITCHRRRMDCPAWLGMIPPMQKPYFASKLKSLRIYLLRVSPPPFKKRNLFIDSTVGDRV